MNLLQPTTPKEKPKRTYKKQTPGTPRTPRKAKQSSATKEPVGEEPEEHAGTEDELHVDEAGAAGDGEAEVKMEEGDAGDTPVKEEEAAELKEEPDDELEDESVSKPSTSRKREVDEDYDEEADALEADADDDDDEDYEEKPKRKSSKEKKKKEKAEKKPKEPKEKKPTKRKSSLSFEDALGGTPKSSKKKHDPKKDKPMFVGGLPMAAIQEGPVVPNAYNYDPMAEIMKLGTGQLQSAYRKSRMNITPPKDKKMYKLEPKHHEEEGGNSSVEKEKKAEPPRPPAISPLSINTRRLSEGVPAPRPSPSSGPPPPPPRVGFMPRLHDIPPSTASSSSKSPMTSPAPRKVHATSVDGIQKSPAEFSPAAARSSRGSFSEFGRHGPVGQISPSPRNGSTTMPSQQHTSPIPSFSSPRPPTKQVSPSDPLQRDDAQRSANRPQETRKARFADNPVSDISPPPVSTTPPFMPSPAPPLRSPDLPPVFTSSSSSTPQPANSTAAATPKIPMKQALVQLGQIVKELNEVNAL